MFLKNQFTYEFFFIFLNIANNTFYHGLNSIPAQLKKMYFLNQKRKQFCELEMKCYNVGKDGEKRHVKIPMLKIHGEPISRCLNPKSNPFFLESS